MLVEVYGAPTDTSCREWFRRSKDRDFSVEDKPLDSQKKFEDKELETLLEEESNARGVCRIIGGNSTSRFCTIERE